MWLPTVTTIEPVNEPIDTTSAATYLRLDADDLDDEVGEFIAAARAQVEAQTGTRLIRQTVQMQASSFKFLDHLPTGPLISIESVSYIDASGEMQTLDPDAYEQFGAGLAWGLRPAINTRWPATRAGIADAVTVTAVMGYGDAADAIPRDVRLAMLKLLRGMLDDQPVDVSDILVNHKIWL